MQNKIALIIPYFGNFPNYFNYWLKSALNNPEFDFLIFTNNKNQSIKNVKFINTSFLEFKKLLQRQVDFPIYLTEPYKICDYRPLFGLALKKYLKKYDFWGFCDLDLIFGNLSHFITPEILHNYDKIYDLGHLTILRNNEQNNNLWRLKHHEQGYRYDEAFKTPYPCHFDETDGLTQIAKLENIKIYSKVDFADIDRSKFNFVPLGKQHKVVPSLFLWKNGKLLYYFKDKNRISMYEVAYAHFQKRQMEIPNKSDNVAYFDIIPNKFINDEVPEKYLKKIKVISNYPYYKYNRRKEIISKLKKNALQQRIYRMLFKRINRVILDRR